MITHLQYHILWALGDKEVSGIEVRKKMNWNISLVSFYQTMTTLERGKYIKKRKAIRYNATISLYKATKKSQLAMREVESFYKDKICTK